MTERRLAAIGLWGALLTVAVVAASVALRLGTTLDAGGHASSVLAPRVETAVRAGHRLAASTVALLAIVALVVAARARPVPAPRLAIVAWVLALTLFLSIIGIFTTGYRFAWITAGNVAGGTALACAFWWLRVDAMGGGPAGAGEGRNLARVALALVIAQATTGALASAFAMAADRSLEPLHVSLGPAAAAVALAAALACRRRDPQAAGIAAAAAIAQLFLGMAFAASEAASLGWLHALAAAILALGLARLSVSPSVSPAGRPREDAKESASTGS